MVGSLEVDNLWIVEMDFFENIYDFSFDRHLVSSLLKHGWRGSKLYKLTAKKLA